MKNLEGKLIANTYETLYNSLSTKGLRPRFQKLDNEASNILIQILQGKILTFSWCHQTRTGTMQLNDRYKYSGTIVLQYCTVSIQISH